jgi:regulator of protease activity HflC (stomatin/prohibitin superfamily)
MVRIRTVITVELHERAILLEDGLPVRALAPGRHVVWTLKNLSVASYDTRQLTVDMPAEHQMLMSEHDLRVVSVADHERALVKRRGKAVRWLAAGIHLVWTVDKVERTLAGGDKVRVDAIDVLLMDTGAVAADILRDEVKALVPASDYVELIVPDGHVALRTVDGAVDAELGAGRHAAWTTRRKVGLALIDLRDRVLAITGQEVMTKDKVSLRLNAAVTWKVVDARRLGSVARNAEEMIYLAAQMGLREQVAGHTLDELLGARDLLAEAVLPVVAARAQALGLAIVDIGVKDLVLPGEMKTLLNRVTEAVKEAEANVILRREETAATRSMAQTAKVLADNPLLIRLKELEAYKELAAQVGTVHVVIGSEGLSKIELKT